MPASKVPTVLDDGSGRDNGTNSPRIHVSMPTHLKILRSPSRDSVAMELSLCSVSSCQSDIWKVPAHLSFLKAVPEQGAYRSTGQHLTCLTPNRGPSPIPGAGSRFLKVPSVGACRFGGELWWEEETDLNVIKSCSALSHALGLQKSFSTGDIVSLDDSANDQQQTGKYMTQTHSESIHVVIYSGLAWNHDESNSFHH